MTVQVPSQALFQVFIQGWYYIPTLLRIYSTWEKNNVQSPSKVKSTRVSKNGQDMVKIRFFGLISTEYVACDWKSGLPHKAISYL